MQSRLSFLVFYILIHIIVISRAATILAAATPQIAPPAVHHNKINFPVRCNDTPQICTDSGTRVIDRVDTHRDCWNYSYKKTCNYPLVWPQKDQCSNFKQCYIVANRECLLKDVLGQCVSQKREFSCKRHIPVTLPQEKMRIGLKAKEGVPQLICKGEVPCLDGNCFDKSYLINNEMMESVSKLYAISQAKSFGTVNARLFEGLHLHCTKKATEYSNCCKVEGDGWGHNLGARCSTSEKQLIEYRKRNKCVYIGKTGKGGITGSPVKHHYCCWNNMLNKVLQVEGRKQLGINFGSGSSPSCRGLTIEELTRLDFSTMDFSEFISEIAKQMKIPNTGDLNARVQCSSPNMRKFDEKYEQIEQNKRAGINPSKEGIMGGESDY
jgi:conjugal transfer mating pair stabilization protein TraN